MLTNVPETTATVPTTSPLAKIGQAAEFLNLSRSMVYVLLDKGELPYIRIGRCRRIRWSDLQAFVAAC
jgi:excisionase family DNA binding protein